jgi:hypothetical protein
MHCSVKHWQDLDERNWVAAAGWLLVLKRGGDEEFLRVVRDMREGARPVESAALVVMGAAYPKDLRIRGFLRQHVFGAFDDELASASIFGLTAHLDHDETIRDRLLVQQMKWMGIADRAKKRLQAISEAFFIWDTSGGSGTCLACGQTRSSPLTPKQQA